MSSFVSSHLPEHLQSIAAFERMGAPERFALPWNGNTVQSGCEVSPDPDSPFDLQVSAGVVSIHGLPVDVAAQAVNVRPPVPGGHHRLSLVVVDQSGRASVLEGLDSSDARYPSVPADSVAVASLLIPSVVPPLERIAPELIADRRPLR